MMRRILAWGALLALGLAIKFLFVDRYFPESPGNMLIWLLIAAMLCTAAIAVVIAYMLLNGRHRGN